MAVRSALSFIDYTNRDWTTIRDAVVEHLRKRFPDDFTDITESNLGIAFIEAISYMYEVLSFSLDRAANENFLATAQQRDSVAKLVGLLGYKLAPATAAAVSIHLIDVTADRQFPILIEAGTTIRSGDVIFEVDRDYVITQVDDTYYLNGVEAPLTGMSISAVEGSTYSERLTGTGSKLQQFNLSRSPYVSGSLSLSVEGTPWTLVDSLSLGDPNLPTNGNIFELSLNGDDVPSIRFGDGTIGNIPIGSIIVTYRVGGGQRGNVTIGSVSGNITATEALNLGTSFTSSIEVTNDTVGSGGSDRESIASAKTFAPAWARTMNRAITLADYEALSTGYSDGTNGRIAKASVVVGPSDGISNVVTIYALAEDIDGKLTQVSDPLKESLHKFISDRKVVTTYLSPIGDGDIININVDLSVRLASGFDRSVAIRRIESVVASLFKSSRVRYDNKLNSSWIHDYVVAVPGVVSCSILSPSTRAITKDSTGVGLTVRNLLDAPTILANAGESELYIQSTTLGSYLGIFPEDSMVGALIFDSNGNTPYRVLANDDAAQGGSIRCVLDRVTEDNYSSELCSVTHPRKLRFNNSIELLDSTETADDLVNRRLNTSLGSPLSNDVDYSIDAFDIQPSIFTVGRDFATAPAPGSGFVITPDFFVEGKKTIDLGSINVSIEGGTA